MCDSSHPVGQPLDAGHLSQHSVHCSFRFQLEQQDYKLCSFNFTPVSVTIFSVFCQTSCYRLTNAANFRPPLTFDASWCERRESNSHKGRLDPVLQDVTQPWDIWYFLAGIARLSQNEVNILQRSQHFIAMSTFHYSVKWKDFNHFITELIFKNRNKLQYSLSRFDIALKCSYFKYEKEWTSIFDIVLYNWKFIS